MIDSRLMAAGPAFAAALALPLNSSAKVARYDPLAKARADADRRFAEMQQIADERSAAERAERRRKQAAAWALNERQAGEQRAAAERKRARKAARRAALRLATSAATEPQR